MKYLIYIFTMSFFLFFTSLLFAKADLENDRGKEGNKAYHIFKDIDLISTKSYQYEKPRIVVRSVYPQLESDSDSINVNPFNTVVMNIVQEEVQQFKNQVLEQKNYQFNLPKNEIKNELYIDYNASGIRAGRNPIISVRFSIEGSIAGMAHPYHYHRVLNYNLRDDEEIELNDLFKPHTDYLQIFSDYSQDELSKHLQQKDFIAEGTAPKFANYKNWNIKSNGILITFDEYQVAAYVYGAQTVLIPYSILKPVLSAHSPIAGCVKNPKNCGRNNILTGGFIDEATVSHQTNHMISLAKSTLGS